MLWDVDSDRPIRWVIWADLPDDPSQPGTFEAFSQDPERAKRMGLDLAGLVYQGTCRLRFIPSAPRRVNASSPRDLINSLDEARKRLVQPRLLIPGEECEMHGCHRLASWNVSDETEIEPEVGSDGKRYERAVTVRVHSFCDRHYRNPVTVSIRGVEKEVEVEARPQ